MRERRRIFGEEFLRRFLQHVLPRGFPRIRYFGLLANRRSGELLPLCRTLLQAELQPVQSTPADTVVLGLCPCCQGPMRVVERFTASELRREQNGQVGRLDSS
jgi:Putative transposase